MSAEIMRDALDHIARIAGMARNPTRRLDWIAARARHASEGKPYDRDALPQYPKVHEAKNDARVRYLRRRMHAVVDALDAGVDHDRLRIMLHEALEGMPDPEPATTEHGVAA